MKTKGQIFEILGFLILAVAIIGIILFMRVFLVGSYGKTFSTIVERQLREGSDAGVNSLLMTTEDRSGKNILELVGIAAYLGDSYIDLGPATGKIDLVKEIEWRFDAIYGKGHWYFYVPFPNITANIQMVVIADTSASMCDDLKDMNDNLPNIVTELERIGKQAEITIYLLPGQNACVLDGDRIDINCGMFTQTKNFQCRPMAGLNCQFEGYAEEDWASGIICAIENGPAAGWERFSTKIIIPISDELPGGSECGQGADCTESRCPSQRILLNNAIFVAEQTLIPVFPLRADPCGYVCQPSQCADLSTYLGGFHCTCGNGLLNKFMNEIAQKTGGNMFELSKTADASQAIGQVITLASTRKITAIEIGTKPPITEKNIRSTNVLVPVSLAGVYTEATIKEWS